MQLYTAPPGFGRRRATTRNEKARLAEEFEEFFRPHRRPYLPTAERVFALAWGEYRRCKRRLRPGEYLSIVYEVLTGSPGDGIGLFRRFDPALYHGRLRDEDHFINMFGQELRSEIERALKKLSDRRCAERACFRHQPEIGLLVTTDSSAGNRSPFAQYLPEALATLDPVRREVVERHYWDGMSFREIGRALRIDHKTAKRKHDEAVDRLRGFFRADIVSLAA